MRVKDLVEHDRPRERLLAAGHEALTDRELLALLIGSGTHGTDAITLAAKVIEACGGLARVAQVEPHELLGIAGMGPAKAARVVAAFHIARRAESAMPPRQVRESADLADIAAPLLRGHRTERVVVIVCDSAGNVLRTVRLTDGGADRSLIPIRDVLRTVLSAGGASFGLAHNHPSGNIEPSQTDRHVTGKLIMAADTVGLRFLDHVIVTATAWRRIHE
jgi:DNA repair protein RadC